MNLAACAATATVTPTSGSTDITLSLRHAIPPEKRCLVQGKGKRIWLFPPDYVECVERTLLSDFPELRRKPAR